MMVVFATLLGILIAGIGLVCLANPAIFQQLVATLGKGRRLYFISLFRVLAGVVLIIAAPSLRLSEFVMTLGSLLLLSGALGLLLGPKRLRPMVNWWMSRSAAVVRLWALLAACLGGVLLFAVI